MATTVTPHPREFVRARDATLEGPLADLRRLLDRAGVACELILASGQAVRVGASPPAFALRFHTDLPFGRGLGERGIAESYLDGEFDVEGDLLRAFDVRTQLVDRVPVSEFLNVWFAHFFRPRTSLNRRAIDVHYELGDDFYLALLDRRFRLYSHGIFVDDRDTLEDAVERKLEQAYRALALRPGMRILDIGAGWGAAEEYFGSRGIHVTGLTIAEDSRAFVARVIECAHLTAEVRLEDFLVHQPAQPYDAVVIFGVIEHIPDYRAFARRVWGLLKPEGRLYLDASASREKFDISSFTRKYIWPGSHTFLCLQDLLRELSYHGMDLLEVQSETRDYELTMMRWAERFDAARDLIVRRWGERLFRAWQLYLWGGAHAFRNNTLQAYHVVARRGRTPGPRPHLWRRALNGVKSII